MRNGLARSSEVEQLYRDMPDVLRRLKTWSHFIFTAYPGFEKLVGQEANRRRKLYNSRIECTYYQFHGPRPTDEQKLTPEDQPASNGSDATSAAADHESELPQPADAPRRTSQSAAQAFGGISDKAKEQAEIFRNRLVKRARHLRRWPRKQGITCYRLYERDEPQVPLVVDRYEDCLHITEYERPHDRSPAEHADWLDLMARTAADALEVDRSKTFLKRRQRQRGTRQHERFGDEGRLFVVHEGGLKFQVNLSDYVDTGLFLDHRITRSMVREEAKGKRFLNLFGYTGAFTVYAAAGGAASTVTVDLSNTYLDWAELNLGLNELGGPSHRFIRRDAMEYLSGLPEEPCFDLAVVDPADVLEQQADGGRVGRAAEPCVVTQGRVPTHHTGRGCLLFDQLPPFQVGGDGVGGCDDSGNQSADGTAGLSEPADSSVLEDGAGEQ